MIPKATVLEVKQLPPQYFPKLANKRQDEPNGFSGVGSVSVLPECAGDTDVAKLKLLLEGIEIENSRIQEEAAFRQAFC